MIYTWIIKELEKLEGGNKKMEEVEILQTIKMLSASQGYYGRLLRALEEMQAEDVDGYRDAMDQLEAQNFADALDLVMFFEC